MRRTVMMWFVSALLASVALAQPDGLQDFPPHPGGRVNVRRVSSGPLTEAEVQAVLAPVPERLRRCAQARARREEAMAASFDFNLEVRANGRARTVDLVSDPRDDATPHERAWLACGRRVMNGLRFPVKDAPSEVRLTLIWMRDDQPHGTGLL
jgi:hypothetical protein